MTVSKAGRLSIWCLLDGKAGHRNQAVGLAEAIGRQRTSTVEHVVLKKWQRGVRSLLKNDRSGLPHTKPDLLIGAGHATHFPLLAFQRRYGGRTVLLMKPSLPIACFDFCLIPDVHKLRSIPKNVIMTRGVLNRVRPGTAQDDSRGLCLVGGPSAHFEWSDAEVLRQIEALVSRSPCIEWTIATSRRTPAGFREMFEASGIAANFISADSVSRDWLPSQLATAGTVWTTQDSVSMTYEALTSGSRVGLLELQRKRDNRVTACIDSLVTAGDVTRWSDWMEGRALKEPATPFCEAERSAAILMQRLEETANSKNAA